MNDPWKHRMDQHHAFLDAHFSKASSIVLRGVEFLAIATLAILSFVLFLTISTMCCVLIGFAITWFNVPVASSFQMKFMAAIANVVVGVMIIVCGFVGANTVIEKLPICPTMDIVEAVELALFAKRRATVVIGFCFLLFLMSVSNAGNTCRNVSYRPRPPLQFPQDFHWTLFLPRLSRFEQMVMCPNEKLKLGLTKHALIWNGFLIDPNVITESWKKWHIQAEIDSERESRTANLG